MFALAGWLACVTPPDPTVEADGAPELQVPDDQLDRTWVVEVVPESALAPFATEPGWVTLVLKRDLATAVRELGPLGGLAAARAHVEAAALFHQAARLAGESYVQTYHGSSALPTDPLGTAHLVSVGLGLRGELAAAKAASAEARGLVDDPTAPWHALWAAWLTGPTWPPDLDSLPVELPAPSVGGWPEVAPEPQYALAERSDKRSLRPLGDPLLLVALAQWHERAARMAAPQHTSALRRLRYAYTLPADNGGADQPTEIPLPLRFGGDPLVAADVDFLVDVRSAASREGVLKAIRRHRDDSLHAAVAHGALVDGRLEPGRVADLTEALRKALVARAAVLRNGPEQPQDVQFAELARAGALRSLGLVAEAMGDHEGAGRILMAAWDASEGAAADPVGRLWFAAWDVANRYPVRAAETIHQESQRVPALTVARLAVDVLNLRVNRENVGQGPN